MSSKNPFDKMLRNIEKDITEGLSEFFDGSLEDLAKSLGESLPFSKMGTSGTSQANSYQILGLEKTATDDEVKDRYKEIMMKLHPDHAGEEMTFLAQLVIAAYKMICMERGIK